MKYIRNENIMHRYLIDEVMIILPEKSNTSSIEKSEDTIIFLDKTAFDIWNILEKENSISEIISKMSEIYDVNIDILTNDIMNFINKSTELEIIKELNDE